MTVPLAVGSDVTIARNGYVRQGRLIVSGGNYWTADDRYPSYPGYDGWNGLPATTRDYHDALVYEIVFFLTDKRSGASILINQVDPTPPGYYLGEEFQAGLTRLGHNYTLTNGGMGGYDPLDFDCWMNPGSHSFDDSYIDNFLSSNGALFHVLDIFYPHYLSRYGIDASGGQTGHGAPTYLGYDTTISVFDVTQTVRHVVYTDAKLVSSTNTMGGTSTIYYNTLGEGTFGIWTVA